jgi:hypothetical protein
LPLDEVVHGSEVFTNGVLNVSDRLVFGSALRPTTWETGTRNAEAFL